MGMAQRPYPSADLVSGQVGSANATLRMWNDTGTNYRVRNKPGIISLFANQYSDIGQAFDYGGAWANTPQSLNECRVTWTGGFSPVPADLQEVCAALNRFRDENMAASVC